MNLAAFPKTLPEFEDAFSDEESCLDYVRGLKWPTGFRCGKCGHERCYRIDDRRMVECVGCRGQTSVTAGTMFHSTKLPLRLWFRAIFEFVSRKDGCNAMDIQRLLGVSYPTAWAWLHKIREAMVRPSREPLAGIVEVDETYVGGPEPGVIGRDLGATKQLIAAAVEVAGEGCGRARIRPVADASAASLQTFVGEVVAEGATARTDGLASYAGLDAAYTHEVTVIGDPKTASGKFPRVHRVFSLLKRVWLGTYHGSVSKKYAAMYCEEYAFRFNRRASEARTHLVRRVLEHAVLRRSRLPMVAGIKFTGLVLPAVA